MPPNARGIAIRRNIERRAYEETIASLNARIRDLEARLAERGGPPPPTSVRG